MAPWDGHPTGDVCDGRQIRRTWAGPRDECGSKAMDVIQIMTTVDQEDPKLPETLPLISLTCPSDFDISTLKVPKSTDDCDPDVHVNATYSAATKCKNQTVFWEATGTPFRRERNFVFCIKHVLTLVVISLDFLSKCPDFCGKTDKKEQIVTFTDQQPPSIDGTPPKDIELTCKDPFPPKAETLTFTDNCSPDIVVESTDSIPLYDVCVGKEVVRKWTAPSDVSSHWMRI